ncbi:hypothetical protein TNCV_2372971 [Trichonephila clavipes]|nr:hypothetical protein TNCV_2372971 [Trichonephila clavipes]
MAKEESPFDSLLEFFPTASNSEIFLQMASHLSNLSAFVSSSKDKRLKSSIKGLVDQLLPIFEVFSAFYKDKIQFFHYLILLVPVDHTFLDWKVK